VINISKYNETLLGYKLLHKLLDYNEETGIFVWKTQLSSRGIIGTIAGNLDNGYIRITINKVKYNAHRLAWLYIYGEWPEGIIDHKNRIKIDNRILNLDDTTQSINTQNRAEGKGYWKVGNKYRVEIQSNGIRKNIGRFDTEYEAFSAYLAAKLLYHSNY